MESGAVRDPFGPSEAGAALPRWRTVLRLTRAAGYSILDLSWLSLNELVAVLADPDTDIENGGAGAGDAAFTL